MQVILREQLDKLGGVGDVVNVKPGFARNYLIPQGLAYEATGANLRRIEKEKAAADAQAQQTLVAAQKRAAELEGVSLTFNVRAGEEGRLFGSITSGDIADRLAEQGIEIDRRSVQLDEPIKALGVFSVPVRLHPEVRPEIKVWVIKED
jgi:large subunit ribosomal protein L9